MALAHAVGNKVEAAYRRGKLLEKRRDFDECLVNVRNWRRLVTGTRSLAGMAYPTSTEYTLNISVPSKQPSGMALSPDWRRQFKNGQRAAYGNSTMSTRNSSRPPHVTAPLNF